MSYGKVIHHKTGLRMVEDNEYETQYFFNDKMKADKVLISCGMKDTEDKKWQTVINVMHYNDLDAMQHSAYWGASLDTIQIYRIIVDIYELYQDNPLNTFLDLIDAISGSSISAAMQSIPKSRIEIMEWIKGTFAKVEALEKETAQ